MTELKHRIISQVQTKYGLEKKKEVQLWPIQTLSYQRDELHRLLKSALKGTQQNVLVLLEGASGCGKTVTLKACFDQLEIADGTFTSVWLNGFIHHNDEAAFNEIIRQLKIAIPKAPEEEEK